MRADPSTWVVHNFTGPSADRCLCGDIRQKARHYLVTGAVDVTGLRPSEREAELQREWRREREREAQRLAVAKFDARETV